MAGRRVSVEIDADIGPFSRALMGASAEARSFARELESADGRMSNLIQTGLALAPALVPLGAAAIPAVAGLANQLGVAALAAGATVLAFKDVGAAVKALDTYKLAPTAANFAKLQAAMDKLGPAGQEFALFVDHLEPKLRSLQSVAEQGLLPGVQDSITNLLPLLPEAERLIFAVSSTLGNLVEQGSEALTDQAWHEFFTSLEADSAVTLDQMGKTVGSLATGFRDLFTALLPEAQGFSAGLADDAAAFADWADGLSQTQGFQEFLNYIDTSGPKALDTLAALANALVKIVEAAAPVGQVVLPMITAVANALGALAGSNVGPAIIATAAAVGTLGRSLAILKAVGLRGEEGGGFLQKNYVAPSKGVIASFREMSAAATEFQAAEREASLAHARYIGALRASSVGTELIPGFKPGKGTLQATDELVAANERQAASAKRVAAAETAKGEAVRRGIGTYGKAAAAGVGLALATSGIADKTGLANTASLALMGTIAGPWGAAIGGGVGLVKDLAAANNDLETAIAASGRALSSQTVDFSATRAALTETQQQFDSYSKSVNRGNLGGFGTGGFSLTDQIRSISDFFTHSKEESKKAADSQLADFKKLHDGATSVYQSMNNQHPFRGTDEELTQFVDHITPALTRAGLKVQDFLKAADGSPTRLAGLEAIRRYFASFDSAAGKSKAVGAALEDLASQMQTDATQANALKTAMDSLFGVELSQSAATDAWIQSLKALGKQLKDVTDLEHGRSKAALDDRAAIRDSVSALQAKINADAAAGVSGDKLVSSLVRGRDAIIRQGAAAGLSRKQVRSYLDTLGLTPKNLTTIIKADGALTAKQRVEALARVYGLTPKELRTIVSQAGADPTAAKITALARLYHLTPKEVRTLLSAEDKASAKVKTAQTNATNFARGGYSAKLFAVDRASAVSSKAKGNANDFAGNYTATLHAQDSASGTIGRVRSELASLPRNVQTLITTTHIDRHVRLDAQVDNRAGANGLFVTARADGGYTDKGQYVPREPQMRSGGGNILWSEPETGWEAYISGKPGQRERNLGILSQAADRLGADVTRRYADGHITAMANGGAAGDSAQKRQNKLIAEFTRALDKTSKSLDKWRSKLDDAMSARHDYAQQVASAYVSDPFGGTLGGFDAQVAYQTKTLTQARADLGIARRKGLSGALYKQLATSGNAALIGQFADLTPSQIAAREQAFNTQNKIAANFGSTAAGNVYNQRIHVLSGDMRDLSHEVGQLKDEIKALRKGKHLGATIIQRALIQDGGQIKGKAKAAARARQR